MVYKKSVNNWYYIISLLLIFLISLVIYSIYLYYIKEEKKCINNEKIIIIKEENKSINNEIKNVNKDIPIYPKELPSYNNLSYQQIGILTSDETDKELIILPLFSKRLQHNKDRFNYYTATDKNNMIRLPIKYNNQNCEDDTGCKEIYNNDIINIDIYKGRNFTATIYKIEVPKYFADDY